MATFNDIRANKKEYEMAREQRGEKKKHVCMCLYVYVYYLQMEHRERKTTTTATTRKDRQREREREKKCNKQQTDYNKIFVGASIKRRSYKHKRTQFET